MRLLAIGLMLGVVVSATACATAPEDVRPTMVNSYHYNGMSCDQLMPERQRLALAVAETSLQQQKTRSADTVGVLMIFLPIGSMAGGNRETQLANLKGQALAVDQVSASKGCGASPA